MTNGEVMGEDADMAGREESVALPVALTSGIDGLSSAVTVMVNNISFHLIVGSPFMPIVISDFGSHAHGSVQSCPPGEPLRHRENHAVVSVCKHYWWYPCIT